MLSLQSFSDKMSAFSLELCNCYTHSQYIAASCSSCSLEVHTFFMKIRPILQIGEYPMQELLWRSAHNGWGKYSVTPEKVQKRKLFVYFVMLENFTCLITLGASRECRMNFNHSKRVFFAFDRNGDHLSSPSWFKISEWRIQNLTFSRKCW